MAIFHLAVKVHARSTGASAVAAAAYRSQERLVDERTGETHDYSRRGDVDSAEIHVPANAPEWARDRSQLWNAVEASERRKDAQVAREVVMALPVELSGEQRRELVRGFVAQEFTGRGMVADVAYHDGGGKNPHAHILLTTRQIGPDGFGAKDRTWNGRELVRTWREQWAVQTNRALAHAGRSEWVDHRSLQARRVAALERGDTATAERFDRVPNVHLGAAAWKAMREQEPNERTDAAAAVAQDNRDVAEVRSLGRQLQEIEAAIRERIQELTRRVLDRVRESIERARKPPTPGWEHSR
ncbi:MAG: MobA/MobL family protein [Gemmatimonadetes bacterium]|nr:MobA/MobL family protein [Acidobacteriota bacterium]MYA43386.1 MobA/MobL family protein [Gemmatimonadota bacterium]MYE94570.1 MobA/MobL family protein [Gemmatimonadota bacterium]MYJ10348.1 MobA/MobL family protein [Gemmatimonadota bacterium]